MKNIFTLLFIACFMLSVIFSFSQGNWTQKTNYGGAARYGAAGFTIGTKAYVGMGYSGAAYFQDFWEWDQTTDIWTQKASLPGVGRFGAVCFSIGTKGYIGTGYTPSYVQDFWEWDQATDTWTQKAGFPGVARLYARGFSIGNKGYIGTGFSSAPLQDFWAWDQATDAWTQKANLTGSARHLAIGFSIGTKGYIGTGWNSTIYFQDFYEYTPDTLVITGEDDLPAGVTCSVYPNPAQQAFTIAFSTSVINAALDIYNIYGAKIKTINNISGNKIKIERGNLVSGIYFIHLVQQNKTIAADRLIITW